MKPSEIGSGETSRRFSLAAGVIAFALQASVATEAATGFTYELVRSFGTVSNATGSEDILCSFAFNDLGQIAYYTQASVHVNGVRTIVTSVRFWDGTNDTEVYRDENRNDGTDFPQFSCSDNKIGLSSTGLIAVNQVATSSSGDPKVLYFRPGRV